jgi:hypothetical protein
VKQGWHLAKAILPFASNLDGQSRAYAFRYSDKFIAKIPPPPYNYALFTDVVIHREQLDSALVRILINTGLQRKTGWDVGKQQ